MLKDLFMLKVTLNDLLEASQRLKGTVKRTALEQSVTASKLVGSDVYFKYENEQITGSFKIRGAYNKISTLTDDEKKRGVVASSAGNHAQGVAYSAKKCGVKSTIIMPEVASLVKINATREYGAEVILKGNIYDEAFEYAQKYVQEKGSVFIPPFQDEKVVAGQGTIGLEIYEDLPAVDTVIVPVGGGGLISGVAVALKIKNPNVKVIGVQSNLVPGMVQMFHKQSVEHKNAQKMMTIADGIAVKNPSRIMYESFIEKFVDEMVTVTDDEIAEAILFLIEKSKSVAEGSGAAALAALMKRPLKLGKKVCVIISGGNIDLNIISKIIDQGLVKKGRLAEIQVVVPDLPGLLSRITSVIAAEKANILQVHHDRSDRSLHLRETRIELLIETTSHDHVEQIKKALLDIDGIRLL